MSRPLYRDLSTAWRERFGSRVQRISLDAGLTCPNRDGRVGVGGCIYCNPLGSGTGLSRHLSITEQLERGKDLLRRRYKARKFIAYFQSFSNTYAPLERLRRLYDEALSVRDVVGLTIGTRPDCVGEPVLDLLGEMGQRTYVLMEYGLQSMHDRTLDLINRGHHFEAFVDAVARTRRRGLEVCAHVILGLPGEDKSDMLETARALGRMDIQGVKIHLLYVIRNTPLHRLYQQGAYRCLSREAYVDAVCDFLSLLPPEVIIHRLTGDPHPQELVAPLWALEKQANLQAIRDGLRERHTWQGKAFEGSRFERPVPAELSG
ncbi:MAG: TIGR01212 family radical SAM protein [Deltaproteobacteria bacterium]|nr:TIGR01212 family radical SAM protein [Deltaproteobacteria bacterium]MBW2120285.1 TIGR01212 family radical SAM protein [Deltaproteobacteria bacterium]